MNGSKYILSAAVGAVVACGVSYLLIRRAHADLAATGLGPAFRVAGPVAHIEPAASASEAEVDRALLDDVVRLMRENDELNAQLAEARARLAADQNAFKATQEQLDELRRPMLADVMSSTLRAELKSGEVVVTGGYRLADGRRLYAFTKPIIADAAGTEVVTIEGRYLTLTDDAGQSVGLDSLATNAANTLQHGEVWVAAEEEEMFAQLLDTPGAEVVAYPGIVVLPGESGTISVGDIRMKVKPSRAGEGDGLAVELRLEQAQPEPSALATAPSTEPTAPEGTP